MLQSPDIHSRPERRSAVQVSCFLAIGSLLLYTLPYAVPSRSVLSDAYAFGYNTQAGLVLLLLFAAIFGWYSKGFGAFLPPVPALSGQREVHRSRVLLLVFCGLAAILCAGIWHVSRPGGSVQEASFFLPQFEQYRMGKHLYADLDFPYGPLMFFPTVWLARVLHLTYTDAYFLTWTCEIVAGIYLLWKVVDLAAGASLRARWIFASHATFFVAIAVAEGLQYTGLRFCASLALAMVVERGYRLGESLRKVFLVASLGCMLLLFFSPEMGIQFFAGTLIYFVLCIRVKKPGLYPALALFASVFFLAVLLAFRIGEFRFLLNMGSGSLNVPLIFNYTTLVPILFVIGTGAVVAAACRRHQTDHPLMYLVALSLITLPSGMGRCDGGHIMINTVGASIALLAVLSQDKAWFRIARIAYISVSIAGTLNVIRNVPTSFHVALDRAVVDPPGSPALFGLYSRILTALYGSSRAQQRLMDVRQSYALPTGTELPAGTWLNAPLGPMNSLRSARTDLLIDTGRYPGGLITSRSFAQNKIRDIQSGASRLLLLPDYWKKLCSAQPSLSRGELLAPVIPQLRHQMEPIEPVCRYIELHYQASWYGGPLPHSVVLQPRTSVTNTHPQPNG